MPTKALREPFHGRFEFRQERIGAEMENAMNRAQPQGVEMKCLQPIERVLNKKSAYFVAARIVKIDGLSPGSSIPVGEIRGVRTQVVAFRPEMVVDHVESNR